MSEIIIEVKDLKKNYQMGDVIVKALRGDSFSIKEGEFVVVLGPSGSGKSTLLNIIGGMDNPSDGRVFFKGINIAKYSEKKLTEYRRNKIGFVFQFYNLMSNLTAMENVELATELCNDSLSIENVLRQVDLFDRKDHFPSQMSGGEQQRVAIARAVAKNPEILLCDEPTGALDYSTGKKILKLLKDVNEKFKKTVIVITHNEAIGDIGNRVIKMKSGRIEKNYKNRFPKDPERIKW
ncbi:MAG: ABC transporter ATP-binding protein [Bacillota bacterium]